MNSSTGHSAEQIRSTVRSAGLRDTRRRNLLLQAIGDSSEPVRAEHLARILHHHGFPVSLSTVYRNLQKLCDAGIVRKIARGPEGSCYELHSTAHHHHLICRSCNRTVHIAACPMDSMKQQLEEQTDFRIEDHTLEIFGFCGQCREDRNEAK